MKNTPTENRTTWSHTIYAPIVLLALTVLLPASQSMSQTVLPRNPAALSAEFPNKSTNETAIAVGFEQAIAVYHVSGPGTVLIEIGYAIAELQAGGWTWITEGVINPGAIGGLGLTDPSVAYDRVTGDFLVCAMTLDNPRKILVSRFDAANQQFLGWQLLGGSTGADKPWIVAKPFYAPPGSMAPLLDTQFYVTWKGENENLEYRRSRDGGHTWVGGFALTNVNAPESLLGFARVPAPRILQARPLYVMTVGPTGDVNMRVLRGDDVNSGPHAGEVQFTRLLDSATGQPISIPFNQLISPNVNQFAPPPNPYYGPRGWGIDLAPDPTNSGRLFLVYHDTSTASSTDIDIYLRVLTRDSGSTWSIDAPIRVNNDFNWPFEADQFLPSVKVDSSGRLHIVFYDDRDFNFTSDQTDNEPTPRYDVFYAFSNDQGQNWVNQKLCADPPVCAPPPVQEPAIDYAGLFPGLGGFFLGDYIGIDFNADRVWTCFMGGSARQGETGDKTLIWSTQILLP